MSPLETNNPTTVAPEKCNIPEAQEKEFKSNYYEYSQGTIRGYIFFKTTLHEICETTDSGMKWKQFKTQNGIAIKKTQSEGKMEMKNIGTQT